MSSFYRPWRPLARPRLSDVDAHGFAAAVAAAALIVAVGWLYSRTCSRRSSASGLTDADYSHGFFVVPLAAFFVWERREALVSGAPSARTPRVWPCWQPASSCFIAGTVRIRAVPDPRLADRRARRTVLFLAGWAHLRILAFPIAFLLLMIPLPAIVFNQIAFPLQLLASRLGEVAIAASGVPVLREGNVLLLPAGRSKWPRRARASAR